MLWIDFETYNTADISVGTYRYAETAEILLCAYAVDDGPVRVWDATETGSLPPSDLRRVLSDPAVPITAHNAMFDRAIARECLVRGIGFLPHVADPRRWRCTMVQAYSHALPGSLEACGAALGLPKDKAKLADGKKLIHRFCKPAPSNHKAERYDRHSHPEEWERFKLYAAQDIEAMREVAKRLPAWNWKQSDVEMYHLDQRINDRGFQVDRELVEAGAQAALDDKRRMSAEFVELTGGVVERPTQRAQFLAFLNEKFDLGLDNTRAETFREILKSDDPIDPQARRLMEISVLSNKTSTAKYATLAPAISSDGRFRGGLQFRGAARTRRWAGRTFQPQNLPSRGLPPQRMVDLYIEALKCDCHETLFDELMLYGSAALRGVLIAPPGKTIPVADLSNIEGRANAWLAGERWKLRAFEAYDAGTGPDLYNVTAGDILGQDPYEVSGKDRNVFGKVPDLALGYQGGYGALDTFCAAYGVMMADHEDTIRKNVDAQYVSSAKANYTKWGAERNPDADETEWLLREAIKLAWRGRHPKIVQLWKSCQEAATQAIKNPGRSFRAGPHLVFAIREHGGNRYLLMRLPSGNFLCYFAPRYHEDDDVITYMGIDATATGGMFGKWRRLHTYGGKFVENACQSLSLDIMAANMPAIDAGGFPIVLTVHDEIVAEADAGRTGDELAAMMSRRPNWLTGFPLAAAGFNCNRYRKD